MRRLPRIISPKHGFRMHSTNIKLEPATPVNDPPTGTADQRYKRGRPFISASEIANLINLNPYVPVGDAVARLWQKNNKRTFTTAVTRNKLQTFTPEERMKEIGVLDLATAVIDTEDPKEYRQRFQKVLKAAPTEQDQKIVREFVNTSRGIKHEKTTFENLKERDPTAGHSADGNLYQQTIKIPDASLEYLVSGYIDGVERNNNRIIEIKTRQKRLFNHVPIYEQVQCQAYLFLTGMLVCEHTESYRGQLQSTTLHFEPRFWSHVLERLNKVVLAFDVLMSNNETQDAFLQCNDLFGATRGHLREGSQDEY